MTVIVRADLHSHLGPGGKNPGFDESMNLFHDKLGDGGIVVIANFADDRGRGRYGEFINQSGGDYLRIFLAGKRVTYVPEVGMWVIGGQEIQTNNGHLLAIGTRYGSIVKTTET